ncbi:MATE family efflux transporter [Oceanospirillum maris]|uniref:MATE family efflux transporter n=1 Tax=Oceanospirillum maris TaxID=64977 RepID=UPI001FE13322|nr:MATE family efflux transporter [Oceanospirillum maris]
MKTASMYPQILALAAPIIISNISVPLLGLVDTAVVGHLSDSVYLAGVTLGATLFSFLFWGFGFLRMGTTGAVSQAAGANDYQRVVLLLRQGLVMALGIAAGLLIFQGWLVSEGLALLADDVAVVTQAKNYANIRIWSAPAVLVNYVLMGWFLAQKDSRFALKMLLLGNGINIMLDLCFVVLLGWHVEGVALASVIADYSVLVAGLLLAYRRLITLLPVTDWSLGGLDDFRVLFRVNRQLMVRTWLLLGSMAYFTAQGAAFGSDTLAANAILMQFIMMASYALDGYAHAVEALVGQAEGMKDRLLRHRIVVSGAALSGFTVITISGLYGLWGRELVGVMTDIPEVQNLALTYLPWAIGVPLLAAGSYLLDGVYIGLMRSDVMRNGMLVSFTAFLVVEQLTSQWANQGLWFAFACFMLLRSSVMAVHYCYRLYPSSLRPR